MEGDKSKISNLTFLVSDFQKEIYEPVQQIMEHYQENITAKKELLQVSVYYLRKNIWILFWKVKNDALIFAALFESLAYRS